MEITNAYGFAIKISNALDFLIEFSLPPIYEGNIQGPLFLTIEITNAYDFAIQISNQL